MAQSTVKEEIARRVDELPPELQQRVLEFARTLAHSAPKGTPGKQLLRFAGILGPEDARLMTEAIEEACERVDLNEW